MHNSGESCDSGKNINSLAASLSSSYSAAIACYFFFGQCSGKKKVNSPISPYGRVKVLGLGLCMCEHTDNCMLITLALTISLARCLLSYSQMTTFPKELIAS